MGGNGISKVSLNELEAVAAPRSFQLTVLWIDTIKVVEVSPIPTPTKKEPSAAKSGPESGVNRTKITLPIISAAPPISDVFRKRIFNIRVPAIVEAIGQPIDIVVKLKPASIGERSITPCTKAGRKLDIPISIIPVMSDVTFAIKMERIRQIKKASLVLEPFAPDRKKQRKR